MEIEGTTPSEGGNGKRRGRRQRRWDLWRQRWEPNKQRLHRTPSAFRAPEPFRRPLWQEPLRGALYAAGGSAITLFTTWAQHWMW
ncbi:hypothetical protein ACFWIY_17630 [Streptomyces sioyaensis]|uniref:hypothetical protein n=1 Tax=Streptomyces sioyaensis TaxID=67364 RepID=UPI00365DE2FF